MRLPRFALSCLWGTLCGAGLGALRTGQAARQLLDKGRALEAAGMPSLPGPSHWQALGSAAPPAAGAVFFGLSLGLGWGAIVYLWVEAVRGLPGRAAKWTPWLCLAVPAWTAVSGDLALGLALAAAAAGVCLLPSSAPRTSPSLLVVCSCIAALGFVPWARAPEGAFSRFRDNFLLAGGPGLAVCQFYYRWTLYPAEVLKPVNRRTQPTVAPLPGTPPAVVSAFRSQALPLGILVVSPGSRGSDLSLSAEGGSPLLLSGNRRLVWPEEPKDRRPAWERFCREIDRLQALRRATALALFVGCPVGLLWALGALCVWAGNLVAPRMPSWGPVALAGLLAVLTGIAGAPDPVLQALRSPAPSPPDAQLAVLRQALSSPKPSHRAAATKGLGPLDSSTALLLGALDDPVVSVRYAAAEALGANAGPGSKEALLGVLRGSDEWYVKERAYTALWRLGWRPDQR